jgi:hypothetical protein
VQRAYAAQLAELDGEQPDLERCARLAAEIDADLATLPTPEHLLVDPATRQVLAAAARQSAALLERSRAALLARQAHLRDSQSRAERSDGALRAYQAPEGPPAARFLDRRQ